MGSIVQWIFGVFGWDIPASVAKFFGIGRAASPESWSIGSPASLVLWTGLSMVFAFLRVSGLMVSPTLPALLVASLKDAAHIYTGCLIGGAVWGKRKDLGALAGTLSAVELATFLLKRFG